MLQDSDLVVEQEGKFLANADGANVDDFMINYSLLGVLEKF